MHFAAHTGSVFLVKTLLFFGCDPNSINSSSIVDVYSHQTPLHFAMSPGVVYALVKAGANVNATGFGGFSTPLHKAAKNASTEVLQALIDCGADVDACKIVPYYIQNPDGSHRKIYICDGDTPLWCAIVNAKYNNAELLIKHGAKIDGIDEYSSHLIQSIFSADIKSVDFLLKHGADPNREIKMAVSGKFFTITPMEYCRRVRKNPQFSTDMTYVRIEEMLVEKCGKPGDAPTP